MIEVDVSSIVGIVTEGEAYEVDPGGARLEQMIIKDEANPELAIPISKTVLAFTPSGIVGDNALTLVALDAVVGLRINV